MFNGYFNDDISKRAWNKGLSIGAKLILMVILVAIIQYYGRQHMTSSDEASVAIAFVLVFMPNFTWSIISGTVSTTYKVSSKASLEGFNILQRLFKNRNGGR